ncbi:MAG: GGDEF domain-containing protein [Spirochaetia bacterium]|nr:GGDEF domain-containing protein [Spirochaetia bacterium]
MDKIKWLELWKALEILSKSEDEISLFRESSKVLAEIFPDIKLYYYKVNFKRKFPHQKNKHAIITLINMFEKNSAEELLLDHPDLNECFSSGISDISKTGHMTTYIFPLSFEREMQYIIKIQINEIIEHPDPVTPVFFNIFINFYYAIRSNERDFLTNLYNRRAFDRKVNTLQDPNYDYGKQDFLILVDIDFFKKINDSFGHMIGDEVLILFSRILKENIRAQDTIFRIGGEEFVILTLEATHRNVFHAAERLRTTIQNSSFPQIQTLTISIGYTAIDYPLNIFYTLKKADQALYYGKEHGRNQVFSYEWLVDQKKIAGADPLKEVIDIW